MTSDKEPAVGKATKDCSGEIYLILGERSGEYERFKLSEEVAKSLRKDLNALLD